MTKKDQAELTRRAKRLGQLLKVQEWVLVRAEPSERLEQALELEFLKRWVARTIAEYGLIANDWAWK